MAGLRNLPYGIPFSSGMCSEGSKKHLAISKAFSRSRNTATDGTVLVVLKSIAMLCAVLIHRGVHVEVPVSIGAGLVQSSLQSCPDS